MAKGGDKRRLDANTRKLKLLLTVTITAAVLHAVLRLGVFRSSVSRSTILGFLATLVIEFMCYRSLARIAEPTYGSSGELVSGGGDLALGGITAYYFDGIYISIFAQLGTILWSKAWLVFLMVPAYALWQLWANVLKPWIFTPAPAEVRESEAEKARREKTERRAQRRSQRYA